jgi:hypothetical protein
MEGGSSDGMYCTVARHKNCREFTVKAAVGIQLLTYAIRSAYDILVWPEIHKTRCWRKTSLAFLRPCCRSFAGYYTCTSVGWAVLILFTPVYLLMVHCLLYVLVYLLAGQVYWHCTYIYVDWTGLLNIIPVYLLAKQVYWLLYRYICWLSRSTGYNNYISVGSAGLLTTIPVYLLAKQVYWLLYLYICWLGKSTDYYTCVSVR